MVDMFIHLKCKQKLIGLYFLFFLPLMCFYNTEFIYAQYLLWRVSTYVLKVLQQQDHAFSGLNLQEYLYI